MPVSLKLADNLSRMVCGQILTVDRNFIFDGFMSAEEEIEEKKDEFLVADDELTSLMEFEY